MNDRHYHTNRHLYFAYGANTNHSAMAYRCPHAEFLGTGNLLGHRLVFRGVADIEAHSAGSVAGALWRISDDHLDALDAFEGYPRLYIRKAVHVHMNPPVFRDLEDRVTALVYQMAGRNQHSVQPAYPMYLDTLAEGYADCRLPKDQLVAATRHAYQAPRRIWAPTRTSRQWAQQED